MPRGHRIDGYPRSDERECARCEATISTRGLMMAWIDAGGKGTCAGFTGHAYPRAEWEPHHSPLPMQVETMDFRYHVHPTSERCRWCR